MDLTRIYRVMRDRFEGVLRTYQNYPIPRFFLVGSETRRRHLCLRLPALSDRNTVIRLVRGAALTLCNASIVPIIIKATIEGKDPQQRSPKQAGIQNQLISRQLGVAHGGEMGF